MHTTLNFSIRDALKRSWELFMLRPWFYVVLSLAVLILNFAGRRGLFVAIVISIAAVIWSYMLLSIQLAAVDGKEELLTFKALPMHIPSSRQFFMLIGVGILSGLCALGGFILLIIPGIYIAFRLTFSQIAYVDRQGGIRESLRYSWHITKGYWWKVFLTAMCMVLLFIAGFVLVGVGLLVAYPLAVLTLAQLYRALQKAYDANTAVAPQPAEIPPVSEEKDSQ